MFKILKCNVVETPMEAKVLSVSRFIGSPCQENSKISQRTKESYRSWNKQVCWDQISISYWPSYQRKYKISVVFFLGINNDYLVKLQSFIFHLLWIFLINASSTIIAGHKKYNTHKITL